MAATQPTPPMTAAPASVAPAGSTSRHHAAALAAAGIVLVAAGIRLALGLQESLDADEATEAVTALRILHGHLALMESSARYLGALDSYVLAPFIAVLGPTLLAVRAAQAALGGCYVALVYGLGRRSLGGARGGLVAAAVAAVFPLHAVAFGERARGYGLLLVLEALFLLLVVRLAWPASNRSSGPGRGAWALAGLVAGIGLWAHLLLAVPVAAGVAAVLARAPVTGWRTTWRGLGVALAAAVIGFSPWLLYNTAVSPLGSLRHLYSPATAYSTSTALAIRYLLSTALPIFVGARVDSCGVTTGPPAAVGAGLAALALIVLWLRRRTLAAVLHGRFAAIEPVDLVLAVAPVAVVATTTHFFNALYCQPRYLMPLTVPLVFAAALVITARLPWRLAGLALAAAWLAAATPAALATAAAQRGVVVVPGMALPVDAVAAGQVRATRPEALWADYWLGRPIQFFTDDSFPVGTYGGYVGFPDTQRTALAARHPSWLFAATDPEAAAFRAECARRGIGYRESRPADGLLLFSALSAPLTPDDLHLPGQRLDQV